jgi:hypothetical protein
MIRARTLERVAAHRAAFVALVQRIYDKEGVTRPGDRSPS